MPLLEIVGILRGTFYIRATVGCDGANLFFDFQFIHFIQDVFSEILRQMRPLKTSKAKDKRNQLKSLVERMPSETNKRHAIGAGPDIRRQGNVRNSS